MASEEIRPGDAVFHRPSGEEWMVLGVNRECNKVAPMGWPITIANLSDCELTERGNGITAKARETLERNWHGTWDEFPLKAGASDE